MCHILQVNPGVASAVMENVCHRARRNGGVAVAPTAAVAHRPLQLQWQFSIDSNINSPSFQRFRMLWGPKCDLASVLALREDWMITAAEERNQATTDGRSAFLMSPTSTFAMGW